MKKGNKVCSIISITILLLTKVAAQQIVLQDRAIITLDTGSIDIALNKSVNANFYLMSEIHQVKVNPYIQVAFIEHLNKLKNLRNIVLEMPHSNAFLYNQYLENGDTTFLRWANNDRRHSDFYFLQLYEYNKELPPKKKLKFIGVDEIMRNTYTFKKAISLFYKIAEVDSRAEKLNLVFKEIAIKIKRQELEKLRQKIRDIVMADTVVYNEIFKDKMSDLKIIITNSSFYKGKRDRKMLNNFLNIVSIKKLSSEEPFFGSFGVNHVNLNHPNRTFKYFLEKCSFFTNEKKVSIIGVQYYNSFTLPNNARYIKNDGIVLGHFKSEKRKNKIALAVVEEYAKNSKNSISIFPFFAGEAIENSLLFSQIDYLIICKDFASLH